MEASRITVVNAQELVRTLGAEERKINDDRVAKETTRDHQRTQVAELTQEKEKLEGEASLAEDRWTRLQTESTAHGVLGAVLSDRYATLKGKGTVNLSAQAVSTRKVLVDKLQRAKGGGEVVSLLEQHFIGAAESADQYLAAWLTVRDWIRQRLPAQIAEVDDPVEALLRLRERLHGLRERLGEQEADLRTGAEGIASGIQVSIRRAHNQVSRLNKGLEGVRFGIVDQIRVDVQRVESMDRVLTALRQGSALEHFFDETMAIEEALDLILKKFAGGHGSGKKLLDYREYIELSVRIRRRGQTQLEPVNPAKLSTGEAIGVGASLMMVVLAEWEQDANFLRGKRAAGSLRFLFLDEAARLSPDSLGVLFDLCDMLELQLLIAAPEIAQVEGVTTYRLVRDVRDDGQQSVRVSGRRAVAKA